MVNKIELESGEMLPVSIDGWGINPQEMTGLRQAITQAIQDSRKKESEENKKNRAQDKKTFNSDKKDREKFNKKLYEQLEKSYVLNKGGLFDQQKRDKARAEFYKIYQKNFKGLEGKFYNATKILTIISQTVTSLMRSFGDPTSKRFGWLQELEKSGVKLTDGFDNAFTTLSNDAKLSHDMFTKLLTQNSKHVARMNALGMNGVRQFSSMSGKIVGKFGLSADQASGVLERYMENVEAMSTDDSLKMRNLASESERYTRIMKELATAQGKSLELLLQENQMKEDSLLMAKVKTQYPGLYEHLHAMGLSDSVIKAIISGRQNEESVKMYITAGGRAIMDGSRNLARQFMSGQISGGEFRQGLYDIGRSRAVQGDINAYMNSDNAFLNGLEGSAFDTTGMAVVNYGKNSRLDNVGANATGNNEGDTASVNALENYRAQKEIMANRWNEVTSVSTGLSKHLLNIGSGFLKVSNVIMNSWIGRVIGIGTNIAKTPAGMALGGWLMGKFIKGQLVNAITEGINKSDAGKGGGIKGTLMRNLKAWALKSYRKGGITGVIKDGFGNGASAVSKWGGTLMKSIWGFIKGTFKLIFSKIGGAVAGIAGMWFSQELTAALGLKKGSTAFKWVNGIISTLSGALSGFMIGGPIGALIGGAIGLGKGLYNAFSSSEEEFSPKFANGPAVTKETRGTLKFLNGTSYNSTTNNYGNSSDNSDVLNVIAQNTKASARAEERRLQHEQFMSLIPATA